MSKPLSILTSVLALALLTGCATIVGGGANQGVTLQSTPEGASYTIHSSSGIQMGQGTTPSTVRLPRKNEYQIQITMPGYQPQTTALIRGTNGWIWGNLVFGWVLGFAIDFLTGSSYTLEPSLVQVTLQEADADMYAIVKLFEEDTVVAEKRLRMIPAKGAGERLKR